MKPVDEIDQDETSHSTKTNESYCYDSDDSDPEIGLEAQTPESQTPLAAAGNLANAIHAASVRHSVSASIGQACAAGDIEAIPAQAGDPSHKLPAGSEDDDRRTLALICRCFPGAFEHLRDDDGQLPPTLTVRDAIDRIGIAAATGTAERETNNTKTTDGTHHGFVTAASIARARRQPPSRPQPFWDTIGQSWECLAACNNLQRKGRRLRMLVISILFGVLWIVFFWFLRLLC